MENTDTYKLWLLIEGLKDRYISEHRFEERRRIHRRIKKYKKLYDKLIAESTEKEIIKNEITTRGY